MLSGPSLPIHSGGTNVYTSAPAHLDLGHPIVVLKIVSGADNFLGKVSLWLFIQQPLQGVQIWISGIDPHQISLIDLLLFLLEFEQAKCYVFSLLFHLLNLYAYGFSTNLYVETFFTLCSKFFL